jgi:hypothetical protein
MVIIICYDIKKITYYPKWIVLYLLLDAD